MPISFILQVFSNGTGKRLRSLSLPNYLLCLSAFLVLERWPVTARRGKPSRLRTVTPPPWQPVCTEVKIPLWRDASVVIFEVPVVASPDAPACAQI